MRLLLLLLAASLTGCIHAPPKDPAGDEAVRELDTRTREAVAEGDAGRLSLRQSRSFLRRSQGLVAALRARSQVSRISADALGYLDSLDRQYAVLLEQNKPLRTTNSGELRTTLYALQNMQPFTTGWRSVPDAPSSSDTSDTTDDDPEKCKKKDRDKEDRRGRGDKDGKKDKDGRDEHNHR